MPPRPRARTIRQAPADPGVDALGFGQARQDAEQVRRLRRQAGFVLGHLRMRLEQGQGFRPQVRVVRTRLRQRARPVLRRRVGHGVEQGPHLLPSLRLHRRIIRVCPPAAKLTARPRVGAGPFS
jgi:hypothetical protein